MNILRRLPIKSIVVAGSSLAVTYKQSASICDPPAFDNKGFPMDLTINRGSKPLHLSGVGMRRKNLYITEVDVYLVGLSLTIDTQKLGKTALSAGVKLADAILNSGKTDSPAISTTLKFVRTVTTTQVVEAFNDAFKGCDVEGVNHFKSILRKSIGENGMQKGEEICFVWLENGGLMFLKGENLSEILRLPDVEKRLLEVYVDPARTVSPELVASLQNYLQAIHV